MCKRDIGRWCCHGCRKGVVELPFEIQKRYYSLVVIGKIVKGSGFEDIIFQSGACLTGSLNGVWMGSHYNRAWTAHSAFSEALERLLIERFIFEYNIFISEDFITAAEVPQSFYEDIVSNNARFLSQYQEFKESIRKGEFFIHLAVQDNDFEMRLRCWKLYLPLHVFCASENQLRSVWFLQR